MLMTPHGVDSKAANAAALDGLRRGENAPMATWLREHLFKHVLPFWDAAVDPRGGLFTCLNDAGEVLSREKWLWSQWRAVWVFARLHNQVDRNPRWLERARGIAEFCLRHGWDAKEEGWVLLLSQSGEVLRGCESTYVDAFAVYALTELYRATRDETYRRRAVQTAEAAERKLSGGYDRVPHFPYPIPPGAKPHGIPMLWALSFAELGDALGEEKYLQRAQTLAAEIFRDFYRREPDLIVEWATLDGAEFPAPEGTVVVPGHAIEDMWFQFRIAQLTRTRPDSRECVRLILRHLEAGWDAAVGGLRLAIDARGAERVAWNFADTKLWWPHTEALYGTLLGWSLLQDKTCLAWHKTLWRFCLDHYADWEHGEWRQKLNHDLRPITEVVALPVKDPFHLPRSLILQIELLERGFRMPAAGA